MDSSVWQEVDADALTKEQYQLTRLEASLRAFEEGDRAFPRTYADIGLTRHETQARLDMLMTKRQLMLWNASE